MKITANGGGAVAEQGPRLPQAWPMVQACADR
jgi:hypothetical protein